MVNANYIVEALKRFLVVFKKKQPNMAAREWFFHWDNAFVHTATIVKDWMAATDFRLIEHLPYLPDLAPADFFLVPINKRQLAGKTLTQETFKSMWGGATQTIAEEDFVTGFRRWYERCEKCVRISSGYVKKLRNKCLKIFYRLFKEYFPEIVYSLHTQYIVRLFETFFLNEFKILHTYKYILSLRYHNSISMDMEIGMDMLP